MSLTNREIQLRKTCELYTYVLMAQGKEIPDDVLECASSYDYPIECATELAHELKSLDKETFDKIVNNPNAAEARDLTQWWEMYQTYIPLQ